MQHTCAVELVGPFWNLTPDSVENPLPNNTQAHAPVNLELTTRENNLLESLLVQRNIRHCTVYLQAALEERFRPTPQKSAAIGFSQCRGRCRAWA